ncbi:proline-rich transmembrane protein 2 [Carettochelys insculpta]|uniref:proline-rich transmembrane protein 2 n=1 Tax=Carettochelys insculpta TaxID=44489 RepID=UPI003EBC4DCC
MPVIVEVGGASSTEGLWFGGGGSPSPPTPSPPPGALQAAPPGGGRPSANGGGSLVGSQLHLAGYPQCPLSHQPSREGAAKSPGTSSCWPRCPTPSIGAFVYAVMAMAMFTALPRAQPATHSQRRSPAPGAQRPASYTQPAPEPRTQPAPEPSAQPAPEPSAQMAVHSQRQGPAPMGQRQAVVHLPNTGQEKDRHSRRSPPAFSLPHADSRTTAPRTTLGPAPETSTCSRPKLPPQLGRGVPGLAPLHAGPWVPGKPMVGGGSWFVLDVPMLRTQGRAWEAGQTGLVIGQRGSGPQPHGQPHTGGQSQ